MMLSIINMIIVPIAAGLIFNRIFKGRAQWLHASMPIISMLGIIIIIAVITASGRDALLNIGLLLILAGVVHNAVGYFLGYWGARASGLSERDCRTIGLDVGMQNGGVAGGTGAAVGRTATSVRAR